MQNPIKFAEQICYSSKETLNFSYQMALKYKDVDGVYVECGCAAGAQVIVMSSAAPNKVIYAFDSFEGIPLPCNRDDQMPGIRILKDWEQKALPDAGKQVLESSGATVVSLDNFIENMKIAGVNENQIITVPGWFEHTIEPFSKIIESIAILRLDGDLYHSTWVCLEHLFSKVIEGGCVIIDDWTLLGCQAACKEYFELIGYKPDYKFISTIAYFYK